MSRWILMTHDRVKRDRMELTQKFLAMMLAVRRPEVSRIAAELKQAGLINYTRDTVAVLDREGLEETTCECYKIITVQLARVFDFDWRTPHQK
jgi:Mn-dependent DtxR family transcriptional regulator